jgi:O-antigen ligase
MNTTLWHNTILTRCQQAKNIGIYGFLIFLPCSIAFSQMCLGLFALTVIVESILTRQFPFPRTPLNRPLFVYIAITLIATVFSVNVAKSINGLEGILVISVFYLFYYSVNDVSHLKKFAGVLVCAMTVAALYGVIQHYLEVDIFRLKRPISFLKHVNDDLTAPVRVSGFFSIYMTFSAQLAMMFPIMCALIVSIRSVSKKVFLGISLLLTGFALLWTYTRSAWMGVLCALIVCASLQGKKWSLLFLILLLLPGILLLQPELLDRSLSMFREKDEERLYTWITTIDMIRDYPLTGIGKGNYSRVVIPYRERRYPDFEFSSRAHAHNNLFQVTADGGLFSGFCFLWLWWVIFREMYRAYCKIPKGHKMEKWLALGFLGAIVAFFIQGFFDFNFGDSESAMMMWLIVALSFKLQTLAASPNTPNHS